MFSLDRNMAESPMGEIYGWQSWEKDLYLKILEVCVETIIPYPSAQTIGPLCDHSGSWDMDDFQATPKCKFQSFQLLN
jgi:hypothetical protein